MALTTKCDAPNLRSGLPPRLKQWMTVGFGRRSASRDMYVRLNGEVLSFYKTDKHRIAETELHVSTIRVRVRCGMFRQRCQVLLGSRVIVLYFDTPEEKDVWTRCLQFGVNRYFESFYILGESLAAGRYSKVYYAHAREDPNETFAVKIIEKKPNDFEGHERIIREKHINLCLKHPSIVNIRDVFCTLQREYLVFELIKGGTLDALLIKMDTTEMQAKYVMLKVLTTIHYIHGKGLIHRDIGSHNLFLSRPQFPMGVKLGDFGFADFSSVRRARSEIFDDDVGTFPYKAMEIIEGKKYGKAVDMWSAGILMYELLSGKRPFIDQTDEEILQDVKSGKFPLNKGTLNGISENAKRLLSQILEYDPNKRLMAIGALQHEWFKE